MRTPAVYKPGSRHFVGVVTEGSNVGNLGVRASRSGRLRIKVPLGPSNTAQEDTLGAETTVHRAVVRIRQPG